MAGGGLVFVPGDVPFNPLRAIELALEKIRPTRPRRNPVQFSDEYLSRARQRFGSVRPTARRIITSPTYPLTRVKKPSRVLVYETEKGKARRVKRELIDAGITFYGLLKSESRALPKVLHDNEHVEAVVYGQHHSNSVMLVATDERIIYLDKKPMALFLDEVSYEVISGIEFEIHTLFATLVLHTPVKNYDIRFANLHCAENFAKHIEAHRLKREQEEVEQIETQIQTAPERNSKPHPHELEDMAGYYWLPVEEEEKRKIQEGS